MIAGKCGGEMSLRPRSVYMITSVKCANYFALFISFEWCDTHTQTFSLFFSRLVKRPNFQQYFYHVGGYYTRASCVNSKWGILIHRSTLHYQFKRYNSNTFEGSLSSNEIYWQPKLGLSCKSNKDTAFTSVSQCTTDRAKHKNEITYIRIKPHFIDRPSRNEFSFNFCYVLILISVN